MTRSRVPAALEARGGVASWSDLVGATSASAVTRAVASGAAVRALPGVLALPGALDDSTARQRAALLHSGSPAALSHTTALARYGLPVPDDQLVHVLVPHHRRRGTSRTSPVQVQFHRSRAQPRRVLRDGLVVVHVARAVVDSWPLLSGSDQRAPALVAVRRRLVTTEELDVELDLRRQSEGVGELRPLVAKIRDGCRSELELWGYDAVFTDDRFEDLRRQVRVVVKGQTSYLDGYDPTSALAIELDGRQYHDSPRMRERDIARDARLATVGIQTVRFSHQRLTSDPAGCREEAWQVMQVRRTQLAGTPLPRVVEVAGASSTADTVPRLQLPSARSRVG